MEIILICGTKLDIVLGILNELLKVLSIPLILLILSFFVPPVLLIKKISDDFLENKIWWIQVPSATKEFKKS